MGGGGRRARAGDVRTGVPRSIGKRNNFKGAPGDLSTPVLYKKWKRTAQTTCDLCLLHSVALKTLVAKIASYRPRSAHVWRRAISSRVLVDSAG